MLVVELEGDIVFRLVGAACVPLFAYLVPRNHRCCRYMVTMRRIK